MENLFLPFGVVTASTSRGLLSVLSTTPGCMMTKTIGGFKCGKSLKKHCQIHQNAAQQNSTDTPGLVKILLCGMCMCECVFPVAVLMKAHWHPDHRPCSHGGTSLINTDIIRVPLWPFQGLCCWHQNWCQLFQISCIFTMNKYCLKWLMIMFSRNVIKRTKGRCALNVLFLLSISFDDRAHFEVITFQIIRLLHLSWAFGYWTVIHKMLEMASVIQVSPSWSMRKESSEL